jgi:hypothetical protein
VLKPYVLALAILQATPLLAVDLHVQFNPLTTVVYDGIDVESVGRNVVTPIDEWRNRVKVANAALADDITVKALATIEVKAQDEEYALDSMEPFVTAARKEAAAWGANQLFLEDTAVEQGSGHLVQLTFTAYRVQYKDGLIPPAYFAALPYNPLPDYFVAQKVQEWNTGHFGKTRMYFAVQNRQARQKNVLAFMTNLKNGTPIRLVLMDGSSLKGAFNGLDQDDQVWIRPSGLGGFITHRSIRPQDIETVGILN